MSSDWHRELRESVKSLDALAGHLELTEDERRWAREQGEPETLLRLRIPEGFLRLIDPAAGGKDPVRKQCVPTWREHVSLPGESSDPLAEDRYTLVPRLVRRYKSRALFLATDVCAMYCRHCFRRHFAGREQGAASVEEIRSAAGQLAGLPEVRELLVSGGDPLTSTDEYLQRMFSIFRSERPDLVIRIGTRMPAVMPSRITGELAALLAGFSDAAAVYVMTQFNHPRELTAESRAALRLLVRSGIPVYNQSVLLAGVNDNADLLEKLCNGLVAVGVKPYYLFQGDVAAGTSHFRTPVERALEIDRDLRRRLSGLAAPTLAVDLPDGGGKVILHQSTLVSREAGEVILQDGRGATYRYPDPDPRK